MVEEMWSPPSARTRKDLDVGSPPYCRQLTHRSRHISFDVTAADHQPSPFRSSFSSVPFSWECRPGIPKTSGDLASRSTARRLPLPPPLRAAPAAPKKRRPQDPFAVALAECAKCPPGPSIDELFSRTGSAAMPRSRGASPSSSSTSSMSISDRLALFGLHGVSCKAACTVVDSAVYIPRPGLRAGNSAGSSYGLPHRRFV